MSQTQYLSLILTEIIYNIFLANHLRKKWKYLRDQFAVELGKMPPPHSGDEGIDFYRPKWPYFRLLFFLKDSVKARTSKGNCSSTTPPNKFLNENSGPSQDSITED